MKAKTLLIFFSATILFFLSSSAFTETRVSTNYQIKTDTIASGGVSSSTNHILVASLGQSSAIGPSQSTNYKLNGGFLSMGDQDSDGIFDISDNCILVANPDQRDTDGDLYGNICDPDFNNDGGVNFADMGILRTNLFSADPNTDLNGDGGVNFADLGILRNYMFSVPGPSGLVP